MTVRCRGTCGRAGTMRAVGAEGTEATRQAPEVVQPQPPKPAVVAKKPLVQAPKRPAPPVTPTDKPGPSPVKISGTVSPRRSSGPERVLKPVLNAQPQSPKLSVVANPMVSLRSDAGRTRADELRKTFESDGLWLRSVQFKNCQCLTEPNITLDPQTRSVGGLFCDAWTYAHPTIPQYLFQLHPTEGKRAVALIVDWTKTDDRYVDYTITDRSSNKTFESKAVAKLPEETRTDMAAMRRQLAGLSTVSHNEVRTCQVRKEALVGLIWSPILLPTGLSDGGVTWEDTKARFQVFIRDLQSKGVATQGLPIFTYEVGAAMVLTYIDFIA